jgi:hypothetical protein
MAGVKALLLVSNKYTTEIDTLNNKAYYPQFDNWIMAQPAMGLGAFKGNSASGKLNFDLLAMFAFETGAKWRVGKGVFLYTGIYFDCGLHDYTKKSREAASNYTYPEHLADLSLLEFTKKINLIAAGLRLRLAFFRSRDFSKNPCPYW